jgi:hypothetical protein
MSPASLPFSLGRMSTSPDHDVNRRHGRGSDVGGAAFPSRYEVHIAGRVSDQTLADYPLLAAGVGQVETIFLGVVRDQSELSSLVLRLQDAGLEVTEFRRLPD